MVIITVEEKRIPCGGGTLLPSLLAAGVFVDNPCNGTGICGKCKVRILEGVCSPVSETERKLLDKEEIESGVRLACMTKAEGDIELGGDTVVLPGKVSVIIRNVGGAHGI